MNIKYNKVKILLHSILPLLVIFFLSNNNPKENYLKINKNLEIFSNIIKEINTYYINDVNIEKTIRIGIKSILESLDPYTNFISESEENYYQTLNTGIYAGIGAIISKKQNKNTIIMIYKNSPAYNGKLKIGDEIIKINGKNVKKKSIKHISNLLIGKPNTKIKISVKRYSIDNNINIYLTRKKVLINNISYSGIIEKNIGYIKLSSFTSNSSMEFSKSLNNLKNIGVKKMIIDLRGNPGGILEEAVEISNLFIKKGLKIVETKGKVKSFNKIYKSNKSTCYNKMPLIILIDKETASSAEIIAGVIQDYDIGILIGENTYGKGLIQITKSLGYSTYLKLTIGKYYIPSGRSIQSIDYKNKNKKKNINNKKFKTKNGRIVYSERGIDPDIKKGKFLFSPITINLFIKGFIFDYSTIFYYENKKIKKTKNYKISEEQYKKFLKWLYDKDYRYKNKIEKIIEELEGQLKKEKNYKNILKKIISLKYKIENNKECDLKKVKKEIKFLLKEEIASRYYLEKGAIESSFDYDKNITEAKRIFQNMNTYYKILNY